MCYAEGLKLCREDSSQAIMQNGRKLSPLGCNNIKSIYVEPLTCSCVLYNLFQWFYFLCLVSSMSLKSHIHDPLNSIEQTTISPPPLPLSVTHNQQSGAFGTTMSDISVDFTAVGFSGTAIGSLEFSQARDVLQRQTVEGTASNGGFADREAT